MLRHLKIYCSIISSDESVAKIENNTLIAIKEGLTSINVISKDDKTKNFVIPVEVQDNLFTYRDKTPEKVVSYNPFMKQFELDSNNNISIKYNTLSNIPYSYKSDLSLGYQNWQNVTGSSVPLDYQEKNVAFWGNKKFVYRVDKKYSRDNNKNIVDYSLYVDIFENDNLKKTIRINDLAFTRDETYSGGAGFVVSYSQIFLSVISADDQGNFTIVWYNQLDEYRARSFNQDGEPITPVTIIDERDKNYFYDSYRSFHLDVSPNGEKIIFSKFYFNESKETLLIKVFDQNLKKLYQRTIADIPRDGNTFTTLGSALVSINDLGEYTTAWLRSFYGKPLLELYLTKYNINSENKIDYSFDLRVSSSNPVEGISINNNSSIAVGFLYDNNIDGATYSTHTYSLGIRYFPGDKDKDYINLKRGQTYKLDAKYSKYVSSNDSVVNIQGSELIAQDLGTATINGFDENDYEKNITLKVNVSL